ncbi:MAG: hypothetical protein KDB61_13545, partial [Planctomycetes bacterium]|nr:hypothetical protein [Planctomycetota bacterium]
LLAAALALVERKLPSEALFRVAAACGVLAALGAAAAYFSGPHADEALRALALDDPAARGLVEAHALWGRVLFILTGILGALSLLGLLQYLQEEIPPRWLRLTLALGYAALVPLLAWASHLGGLVRHTEIRGFF